MVYKKLHRIIAENGYKTKEIMENEPGNLKSLLYATKSALATMGLVMLPGGSVDHEYRSKEYKRIIYEEKGETFDNTFNFERDHPIVDRAFKIIACGVEGLKMYSYCGIVRYGLEALLR